MSDHDVRYPLHNLKEKVEGVLTITCAKSMMLPEQVPVRGAPQGSLWCIGCEKCVPAAGEQIDAASRAAEAEGFVCAPPPPPEVLPGMLSDVTRRYLRALRLLVDDPNSTTYQNERDETAKKGAREAIVHGLVVGDALTDAGRAMAERIISPEVNTAALRFDPAHKPPPPKVKKARAKKPRAEPTVNVMVCSRPKCGHSASVHRAGREDACQHAGCKCAGYIVPQAPPRPRKAKAVETPAP